MNFYIRDTIRVHVFASTKKKKKQQRAQRTRHYIQIQYYIFIVYVFQNVRAQRNTKKKI